MSIFWLKFTKEGKLFNRAVGLSELGKFEETLSVIEEIIQKNPTDIKAWCGRSITLFELKSYQDALISCDKSIELAKRKYYSSWFELSKKPVAVLLSYCYEVKGNSLLKLGRYQDALIAFKEAIQYNPINADIWSEQSAAMVELEQFENALSSCEHAIKLSCNSSLAWYNQGRCYTLMKQYDLAIWSLEIAFYLDFTKIEQEAKNDPAFDQIRNNEEFKKLFQGAIQINEKNLIYQIKKLNEYSVLVAISFAKHFKKFDNLGKAKEFVDNISKRDYPK